MTPSSSCLVPLLQQSIVTWWPVTRPGTCRGSRRLPRWGWRGCPPRGERRLPASSPRTPPGPGRGWAGAAAGRPSVHSSAPWVGGEVTLDTCTWGPPTWRRCQCPGGRRGACTCGWCRAWPAWSPAPSPSPSQSPCIYTELTPARGRPRRTAGTGPRPWSGPPALQSSSPGGSATFTPYHFICMVSISQESTQYIQSIYTVFTKYLPDIYKISTRYLRSIHLCMVSTLSRSW